jgi:hypothetical protein
MQRLFPNGKIFRSGVTVFLTAVAAGQSQRLYCGVIIFNWYQLLSQLGSSDPALPGGPP